MTLIVLHLDLLPAPMIVQLMMMMPMVLSIPLTLLPNPMRMCNTHSMEYTVNNQESKYREDKNKGHYFVLGLLTFVGFSKDMDDSIANQCPTR